ncbi:hypothetical protein FGO68_gene7360 [Halteria grandinella]|uniref:Glutathione S-transferase n=1 Tax=Halteria grandinella TaxID=5974 RepID=A0A8J8NJX6_HALGN|nr:hypothetical protein FGO68_gene7360 [Halteria grandinella]
MSFTHPDGLTLYGDLFSQPVRAIHAFLTLNKVPFTFKHVDLMGGENKSDWYLENIHPQGKMPAIIDKSSKGLYTLFESHAILRYVTHKYPSLVPEHWYPTDPVARARVDQYLDWHHSNMRQGCTYFLVYKYLVPSIMRKINGKDYKESDFEAYQRENNRKLMHYALKQIETFWLKPNSTSPKLSLIQSPPHTKFDSPYSHLTIADLSSACEIAQVWLLDPEEMDLERKYPLTYKWVTSVVGIKEVAEVQEEFLRKNKMKTPGTIKRQKEEQAKL